MKLTMTKRVGTKKSDVKQIRREGNIPSVLYSHSQPAENIVINGVEFGTILRQLPSGGLSTTKFTLHEGKKERKAIIKDIQYHPTTYQILHLDFEELHEDIPVRVNIPIECVGAGACPGIKLGGFLRQVIHKVPVECLPKKIPVKFEIDVSGLGIRQTKRLRDLSMPDGVKPLAALNEVVVVIAKR